MQQEGGFSHTEKDEGVKLSPDIRGKPPKRLNDKAIDRASSKCRKVLASTRGKKQKDELMDEQTKSDEEEEHEELSLGKSTPKKTIEKNRRSREGGFLSDLEVLLRMEKQGIKQLSPANKRTSGFRYPKEATLRVACEVIRRLREEFNKAMERCKTLTQERDEIERKCELLEQKLAATTQASLNKTKP